MKFCFGQKIIDKIRGKMLNSAQILYAKQYFMNKKYGDIYSTSYISDCGIGNDVWIGVDSIIRRGVKVGNGAIIGANSFVNKDVPDFAIVVGNPARIIRYRFDEEKRNKISNSKWWEKDFEDAKKTIERLLINE